MAALTIGTIQVGEELPERSFCCDTVQLFFYNAALWNAHRIHFDAPYALEQEGYPGLVVAGPLMGDWLTQVALEWVGDAARLEYFEFSNRLAAFVGDPLTAGGRVADVDAAAGTVVLELFIRNADGQIVTPGSARVRFPVG